MNNSIQRILFLLLVLFSAMAATPAKSATENVDKSFSVKSGGTLTIESDKGSIKVETGDRLTVEVLVEKTAGKQEQLDGFKVNLDQKGNDIFVEGDGDWNNKVSVKFFIKAPLSFNLDLKTGGGAIGVDDISGKVKVNTKGGNIRIGNVAQGNVDAKTSGGNINVGDVAGNLIVETSGGNIGLGKISGKSSIDTSGGSITLEQGGSDVKAETSGGSIKIGPVKGKVDAETSGGGIRIGMAEDDVIAETSGGAIAVEGSKGSVNIDTAGGNLFVGSSGGPVKAETSGGNIKILQARGYIEADTSGGKIDAEMIVDDKNVDTHVNLESSGGSITLRIPGRLAASVAATLKITRSARRDYRIYSDFLLTIKGEDSSKITAYGDINGGGDKVTLSTTNGDIHIKRLEE
ncbi:MAG: hypothetical protein QNL14_00195 [Deltaproteobacteria bacterium]|nr:hypothetical protein [Deltaproteobacteria bacterium]